MTGPFESWAEAAAASGSDGWQPSAFAARNEARLLEACRRAGVELGAYDRAIVTWLAGWEPWTVAVVAGLIERAAA